MGSSGRKYASLPDRSTCPLVCVKITLAIVPYRSVSALRTIKFPCVETILDVPPDLKQTKVTNIQ